MLPTDRWQRETYYLKGDTMKLPKITKAQAEELTAWHTLGPLRSCKNVHPNTDGSPWGWIEATPGATAINAGDPPKGIKQIVWSGYDGQTNAQRLVDCWNTCLDMSDPEAEIAQLRQDKAELVEVAKNALLVLQDSPPVTFVMAAEESLKAAIANHGKES